MIEERLDLDAIRKSLIHDEAVSNLIWPDFLKEQEIIYNGHYVEDFEEDYSENFEDERKVEIFKQEKEEKSGWMSEPSNHIFYIKPVFGEGEHK